MELVNSQALLPIALQAAVPLRIIEIREQGGPGSEDLERLKRFSRELAEHGDKLLYRSKKKGETAKLFNELGFCIAVMSFCPGGITVFGSHWESKKKIMER